MSYLPHKCRLSPLQQATPPHYCCATAQLQLHAMYLDWGCVASLRDLQSRNQADYCQIWLELLNYFTLYFYVVSSTLLFWLIVNLSVITEFCFGGL
jgi:hypothetical protein